ncbi:hypothetical protein FLA_4610 [Filimonas lacunae]|nr:hypothetical protein FLA_4610 [Filimonas lacunae]
MAYQYISEENKSVFFVLFFNRVDMDNSGAVSTGSLSLIALPC